MRISKLAENDITKIESPKPTTFLTSNADGHVRIIHISYISWDNCIVADINLVTNDILICSDNDKKTIVSSFTGHNCQIAGYRELEPIGCNWEIIGHCENIIKSSLNQAKDEKNYYLLYNLLLHIQSIRYKYVYFKAYEISDAQLIVKKIDQLYLTYFTDIAIKLRQRCYCGITNNLDRRMEEHREKDFAIYQDKVYAIVCMNSTIAAEAERLLSTNYVTCKKAILQDSDANDASSAGNGADEDTCIVYLLMPISFQPPQESCLSHFK
ncbi:hypothetical protein PRABACTJOHN_03215 [Parabacteroides johnsonii DSM 18315]|uniref:GIY-YIG domain-containing protein n=1 Tax=Parabacteroides johnsonii DSM 18315 TaxID=537006 RepID=B7BDU0_9BACT|nr:hypothetical protein [Parabacteroides johnsonii]EEC95403.1 hypothetical protein PRABACTJOHN_03215 [Parabacteroides johnsonii DSM 18315]UEA89336.1 hypothetical protein LK449_12315 [Parabacteroides johnsonii]UWP41499.1 hypothetical protein NQ564_11290 [Parabacteroides johnsonii DSM 18315]